MTEDERLQKVLERVRKHLANIPELSERDRDVPGGWEDPQIELLEDTINHAIAMIEDALTSGEVQRD